MTGRIAHLVADQGLSGDMWLGALVDAGVPLDRLQAAVDALGLGTIRLDAKVLTTEGIAATHVHVAVSGEARRVTTIEQARAMLDAAPLDPEVARKARAVYERLAEAEAEAHGVTVDDVHFHELGDPDTAADIVGTCAGIVALGLQRITCGPVAVGSGTVRTAHGELTVPAPAVTSLLRGFVVQAGSLHRELTTPTGAALASVLTDPASSLGPLRLDGQGRGTGDDAPGGRSGLTLLVGRPDGVTSDGDNGYYMVETTVDDLQPEFIPAVLDRARRVPATRDAWATPTLMKKGRPGYTLSVLVEGAGAIRQITELLFREAGTLGVRWHPVTRQTLDRHWVTVEVDGLPIEVKVAGSADAPVRVAPEYDDVAVVADALGRPVREVYEAAVAAARTLVGPLSANIG